MIRDMGYFKKMKNKIMILGIIIFKLMDNTNKKRNFRKKNINCNTNEKEIQKKKY